MRKKLILLVAILFAGMIGLQAQDYITVSGYVTDENSGDPVPGQIVSIQADSLMASDVLTNEAGYYVDTLMNVGNLDFIYIFTIDQCSYLYHDTTINNPVQGVPIVADFEICVDSAGNDCEAYFTYVSDSMNVTTIQFLDGSTASYDIESWFWEFGDGTSSTEQNPIHTYNAPGTYAVCLTITSDGGSCSSTYCLDVVAGGGGPGNDCQANFYYVMDSLEAGTTVYFYDLSSTPAQNVDSWFWEFGDGTTSTEQNPVHTYNAYGSYNVCLTITADSTCTDTYCETIVVQGGSGGDCEAEFTYYADSTNPKLIYFVDLSTPQGEITNWEWTFGDGTASSEQNPSHQFGEAGTYMVCLSIQTDSNCTDEICTVIEFGNPVNCQASYSYVVDSNNTSQVYFIDTSTPPNAIVSWYWDFGDNATSSEQNPEHTYNAPGTYNVCLTITALFEADSCSSTYCGEVLVQGGSPNHYLGGNTFAGIYQLDVGFAYAYQYENGAYTEVYSQVMDSLGYYLFNPFEGNYYVKVEPTPNSAYFNDFLPTYYGDVIQWEGATMINLNQNIFNADINLAEMVPPAGGDGMISGHIFNQNGNRGDNPASDIQIMLQNGYGEYVGMKHSDEEGYFEFANLPSGAYTLFAEVMGKTMIPKTYDLSDENPVVEDVVMVIGESNIVFGIDEISSSYVENISDVYPNPLSNTLRIDVEMKEASRLEFRVLNLTGQTMLQEQFDLVYSESIELNTSDLKAGMYLLEIITEDKYKVSKPFVKY